MEELLLIGGAVVTVLIVAPIAGSAISPELGQSLSDSGKNLIRSGLQFGLSVGETIQKATGNIAESWNTLLAEAKAEVKAKHTLEQPRKEVEIVLEG